MQDRKTVTMFEGDPEAYETELVIPPRPWSVEEPDYSRKKLQVLDANGSQVFALDFDDVFHEEQVFIGEYICNAVNNARVRA